jgi:hypothetical protein
MSFATRRSRLTSELLPGELVGRRAKGTFFELRGSGFSRSNFELVPGFRRRCESSLEVLLSAGSSNGPTFDLNRLCPAPRCRRSTTNPAACWLSRSSDTSLQGRPELPGIDPKAKRGPGRLFRFWRFKDPANGIFLVRSGIESGSSQRPRASDG